MRLNVRADVFERVSGNGSCDAGKKKKGKLIVTAVTPSRGGVSMAASFSLLIVTVREHERKRSADGDGVRRPAEDGKRTGADSGGAGGRKRTSRLTYTPSVRRKLAR